MKKFMILVLAGVIGVAMVGCKSSDEGTPSDSGANSASTASSATSSAPESTPSTPSSTAPASTPGSTSGSAPRLSAVNSAHLRNVIVR